MKKARFILDRLHSPRFFPVAPLILGAFAGASWAQDTQGLNPVSCLIEPFEVVRMSTPVAGIVAEVLVDRGDRVRVGQVLARLDTAVDEITLDLARRKAMDGTQVAGLKAQVAFLEEQAERNAALAARNAISKTVANETELEAEMARQNLAQAELNRALAALEVEQAEALLDQKILRATVDGIVTERLLSAGEYRTGDEHIATIAKLDVLRVEAFAPIAIYGRIAVGQRVTVIPEEPLDTPRTARITVIDRVFDAATATFGLRMELDNPDLALPAGLRCVLDFSPRADGE
jgi:RND family efflux transporter MFP subunit